MKQIIIDSEGYNRLTSRLEEKRKQLAELQEEIGYSARTNGRDGFENNHLITLRQKEYGLLTRIAQLEDEIARAIVDDSKAATNVIGLGDTCQLELYYPALNQSRIENFRIVSTFPEVHEISRESPIGQFLLGKPVGTEGEATLPNGQVVKIKIISKE